MNSVAIFGGEYCWEWNRPSRFEVAEISFKHLNFALVTLCQMSRAFFPLFLKRSYDFCNLSINSMKYLICITFAIKQFVNSMKFTESKFQLYFAIYIQILLKTVSFYFSNTLYIFIILRFTITQLYITIPYYNSYTLQFIWQNLITSLSPVFITTYKRWKFYFRLEMNETLEAIAVGMKRTNEVLNEEKLHRE